MDKKDYKQAMHFRQQALLHYSQLRYAPGAIRLIFAIAVVRWFGPEAFEQVRSFNRALRRLKPGVAA